MAKPFKSEFDLMAEAYGTVNYSKQAIINEHSSARKVRGYEPQVIQEAALVLDDEAKEMLQQAEGILGAVEDMGFYNMAENGMNGATAEEEAQDSYDDAMNTLYNLQDGGWSRPGLAHTLSRDIVSDGRTALNKIYAAAGHDPFEDAETVKSHHRAEDGEY